MVLAAESREQVRSAANDDIRLAAGQIDHDVRSVHPGSAPWPLSWSEVRSKPFQKGSIDGVAVLPSGGIWAVGTHGADPPRFTATAKLTSSGWTRVPSDDQNGDDIVLGGVGGVSARSLSAVGVAHTYMGPVPIVEGYGCS